MLACSITAIRDWRRRWAPRCGRIRRIVGDNQPYSVDDDTDYSIPEYGERRGLPHVEIEIRQDLIGDDAGQRQWASRLARALHPLALGL